MFIFSSTYNALSLPLNYIDWASVSPESLSMSSSLFFSNKYSYFDVLTSLRKIYYLPFFNFVTVIINWIIFTITGIDNDNIPKTAEMMIDYMDDYLTLWAIYNANLFDASMAVIGILALI